MARYVVTGPSADVLIGGKRVTLGKGMVVPDEADEGRVAHLLDVGLISEAPLAAPAPAAAPPPPADAVRDRSSLSIKELRDLAATYGVDLAGLTSKADILAVLDDALG